jgi:hypothetical protein
VVTIHISWQVGDGRLVKFWEDSWEGHKALVDDCRFWNLKEYFQRWWGKLLAYYGELKDGEEGLVWHWKDLGGEDLSE